MLFGTAEAGPVRAGERLRGAMIQSVQRAAQILDVLGSGTPRLGVTEIADRLGLAKPTVHGLLRTLEAYALVAQDQATGKYSLGPGVLQLGPRLYLPVAWSWATSA